jgi:hypothetical protein
MIALVQYKHKETNGLISKIVWEAGWVQLAVRHAENMHRTNGYADPMHHTVHAT